MDMIATAWRGGADKPDVLLFRRPNDPAQLVASGYHPSNFHGGGTVQVPANYGSEGSLAAFEWTPTHVPRVGSMTPDVLPEWNVLVPIRWDLQVATDQDLAVRGNATLTQVPSQDPAQYTPPGTASLSPE